MQAREAENDVLAQAGWLRRLADPADVSAAAQALWAIRMGHADDEPHPQPQMREEEERRKLQALRPALDALGADLDMLVPAWVARFIEVLRKAHAAQERYVAAFHAGDHEASPVELDDTIAIVVLQDVLQATGERIDAHVSPFAGGLGSMGRDEDEHLAAALIFAGPGIVAAVPKLLDILRTRGIWSWPSNLARALTNASRFDQRVLVELRAMLSSKNSDTREAAIEVLGAIGPAARPASEQLLEFRRGEEGERCAMIYAIARQGDPTDDFLDVLDEAMRDDNGYVRRAAAHALAELTPDSARFVPLLMDACNWADHLHDESLPEAAIEALGRYGQRAREALPRLTRFIQGPIKERTAPVKLIRAALEQITGGPVTVNTSPNAVLLTEPLADDEPLFAVTYQGNQCYIDRCGRLAIRTRFAWGGPFSDARAIVHDEEGGTWVIDRHGRDVFRSTWDHIRSYADGLAAVKKDDKWGFVDRDGAVVIEPRFEAVASFSEGLAAFVVLGSAGSFPMHGYIDRAGNAVIPARWYGASSFREGRAAVCTGGTISTDDMPDGTETLRDRKYGYIDRLGRVAIQGEYDWAGHFTEGLALVLNEASWTRHRYGYVDRDGNRVMPLKFTYASDFKDGIAVVRRRGRRWRGSSLVIDRNGGVIACLPLVLNELCEGLAVARRGNDSGFVNLEGQWVIEPQFDHSGSFRHGVAEVERGEWYGLINRRGEFVWGPTTEGSMESRIESEWD